MQYDIAGNQTILDDPSAGTIAYTYNGFGELISQVNPGSVTTFISYLSDGRIDQKTTTEGVTYYRYNSNKQLANIKSPSNVSRSLGYDSKGRVTAVTDSLPGSNPLVTSITYDSKGRKSTVTHPSAVTETYGYNQNGYLSSVTAGGSARWTTTGINARGQLTTGTYGSNLNTTMGIDSYGFPTSIVTGTIQNYSFNFNPVTGNLAWRQNNKYTGLREDFQYDDLDRLTGVMKNSVTTLTMSYDGNTGGLTGKSDAGTFAYDPFYKPYAINTIDPTTGLVPDSTQTIGYTSFNKVESISENGYEADFIYGSDDQRSRMILKQNGNTILTRWYPTGSYMKETVGGVTKECTFIGGDAYTAPAIAIKQSGTTTYYSVLRDHLGSITHVVNSSGAVVAEYSYDAWGRMRNPSTWTNYEPGSEPALMVAGRGYTGHEHLPWFNTINMNGRLYDPLTGMFLSPDNYVQSGENSQNFNRYSYCFNNPLIYSDPSGMLAAPMDFGREADAYFAWMFDVAGPWHYSDMGGGGGGGGGWGGYVIGADQDYVGTVLYESNIKFYGYSYNEPANMYYSKYTGQVASWDEVYNNYVVPNSLASFSGQVAQDLIKEYQREETASLFGITNWEASLLAGPGGAVDIAYQIANTLNEFNPIAQLWDVIAYAFTGKDRFGNTMSLTQASLKALCVVPIFKVGSISYSFGAYKASSKWMSQMSIRGWTGNTIQEALSLGKKYPAVNKINPANSATRYVHPTTGQSVVVDDITNEIIHLGGPGYKY